MILLAIKFKTIIIVKIKRSEADLRKKIKSRWNRNKNKFSQIDFSKDKFVGCFFYKKKKYSKNQHLKYFKAKLFIEFPKQKKK